MAQVCFAVVPLKIAVTPLAIPETGTGTFDPVVVPFPS